MESLKHVFKGHTMQPMPSRHIFLPPHQKAAHSSMPRKSDTKAQAFSFCRALPFRRKEWIPACFRPKAIFQIVSQVTHED